MSKYNILVEDAEFNLRVAKKRQKMLGVLLDKACKRLDDAEENYYNKSTAFCDQEKVVRSLAAKLRWIKEKIKKLKQ